MKYTKITSGLAFGLMFNISAVLAACPCDKAGDAPTADITAEGNIITVEGGKVVGVGTQITLSTEPKDKDTHKENSDSDGESKDDTFDKSGAIQWKEKNGLGTFSSTSDKSVTFTADEVGDVEIELRIKDDGTHYQDNSELVLVKTYKVKAVDPDGVRIDSQTASLTPPVVVPGSSTPGVVRCPVVWQVTYKGSDLSWVGNLAEKLSPVSGFAGIKALPYSYSGGSSWSGWSGSGDFSYPTSSSGKLTDNHNAAVPVNIGVNQYYDLSMGQGIGYKPTGGGSFSSIGTFSAEYYVERVTSTSGLNPVHNEH